MAMNITGPERTTGEPIDRLAELAERALRQGDETDTMKPAAEFESWPTDEYIRDVDIDDPASAEDLAEGYYRTVVYGDVGRWRIEVQQRLHDGRPEIGEYWCPIYTAGPSHSRPLAARRSEVGSYVDDLAELVERTRLVAIQGNRSVANPTGGATCPCHMGGVNPHDSVVGRIYYELDAELIRQRGARYEARRWGGGLAPPACSAP